MRIALSSALILAGIAGAHADTAKDPSGTWLTEDGRAKIRLDRCGPAQANVCGKVVWLKVPNTDAGTPRTDLKNPDPKKRTRPIIGLPLIDGLKPDEAKFSGEIYNADEGKTYQVSLERESGSELSVTGCLLKVLCGSQTWTKVPDVNQQAAVVTPEPGAKPAPKAAAKPAAPAAKADKPAE
ncbi:uncharacterized protein (DUF2147 family) [Methylobacterium sp. BE186]|uniref:DUF2147 domain-containing protein n=1 Tax=Methylobacterium sp. BE186 TaxID=2817715 RepID=UPI00285A81CE|nr:DUF2147 domain-containing protein [Methylobacterium sp. BE186]MDR7037217.1 uncharacterized protein (DUF2147 family) [Methylobacterium sp. BE186]